MSPPREFTADPDAQTTLPNNDGPDSNVNTQSNDSQTLDSVEPRSYIEVRQSETALNPETATRAMERLYTFLRDATKTGLWQKLAHSTESPLVEWLLVSDGSEDASIRYLVSVTHDLIDEFEGILCTCFPDTYEFRVVK